MSLTTAELQILITARDLASDVLDKAANKQDEVAKKIEKASMVMTAGFAAAGVGATALAVNFERDLDQVGAVAQATEADMASLREEALRLGADTAYSASEAVAAAEELAAGGRSMAQIVGGEMRAAVNLAAAGNYGLADSAKVVATTLDIWKDGSLETTEVINRLAGAANASKFGVDDMSQAIASGAGVANLAGVDFGDFTTTIAATASAFSSGSDAGTSFKTFITALPGNSKEAKEAIAELGLEFYNSNGQLKSMAEITDELNQKMGGLSEQQQTVYLKTIFGNDAFRTAAGLMAMTGDEFTAMSNKMRDTDAMDVAAQRMSNAAGGIEELKGSLETAAITIGTAFLPPLILATEGATSFVNIFSGLPESTQLLVLGAVAITAAMPAMVGLVNRGVEAVKDLGTNSGTASTKLTGLAAGVTAVGVAADIILTKTTGYGLFDHLFGDIDRLEATEEAMAGIAASLYLVTDPAEQAARAIEYMNREVANFKGMPTGGLLENGGLEGIEAASDAYKKHEEVVRATFRALVQNGAAVSDINRAYLSLPPALQKVADAEVNVSGIVQESTQHTAAYSEQLRYYYGELDATAAAAMGVYEGTANYAALLPELSEKTEAARTTYEQFAQSLADEDGNLLTGKELLDAYSEALDRLSGRFMEANPQFLYNSTRLAILNEEYDDLIANGASYSEVLGMTIDQIKAEIEARDTQNDALRSNEDAYKALLEQMSLYESRGEGLIGAAMNIDAAIRAAGLGFEEQVTAAGAAATMLDRLTNNDLPAAEAAFWSFIEIVGKSPEELGKAANAMGPEFWSAIAGKILDPFEIAKLVEAMGAAGGEIGMAMVNGMMGAMNGGFAGLYDTGVGAAKSAADGAATEAEVRSPSRVWMRLGKDMIDGLDIGIKDNLGIVHKAGVEVAREVTDGLIVGGGDTFSIVINSVTGGGGVPGLNGGSAKAVIVSGVPVPGGSNGPVNLPDRPAAPAKPKPTIVSGVPIIDSSMPPVPNNPGEGDWVPVPGSPGLYWSPSLGDFRYFGVDTGNGSFWDGKDFSGPGDPNGLLVWQDSEGVMRWVHDNSPVRNADGTVGQAGFDAIHKWRNWFAGDYEQGPGPQKWSQKGTEDAIAKYNADRAKQLEEAIKASPNKMDSHRASAFSDPFVAGMMGAPVFNEKGPPQWMIDAGLDAYGQPMWAKYGWASDPWAGWTKTNASTYAGRVGFGGLGAGGQSNWDFVYGSMSGKPDFGSTGNTGPGWGHAAERREEIVLVIDGERFLTAVTKGDRSVGESGGW